MQHLQKTGGGDVLPILESLAQSWRRELHFHSSSFFSHSCALFCTAKKLNSSIFKRFRTLRPKTPGWGVPCSSAHRRSQKGKLNMSQPARRKASLLPYLLTPSLPSFPLVDRWAKAGDNFKSTGLAGSRQLRQRCGRLRGRRRLIQGREQFRGRNLLDADNLEEGE